LSNGLQTKLELGDRGEGAHCIGSKTQGEDVGGGYGRESEEENQINAQADSRDPNNIGWDREVEKGK